MKSLIKRGLALTAIAASSCATGLLTPASAAAAATPGYRLESVAFPGAVLTALPYGPIALAPNGAVSGQVWTLEKSEYGTKLVNRDSGECLGTAGPFPGAPVLGEPCGDAPTQVWRQIESEEGNVLFAGIISLGCLNGDFDRVRTGPCSYTAQWRLVPA